MDDDLDNTLNLEVQTHDKEETNKRHCSFAESLLMSPIPPPQESTVFEYSKQVFSIEKEDPRVTDFGTI